MTRQSPDKVQDQLSNVIKQLSKRTKAAALAHFGGASTLELSLRHPEFDLRNQRLHSTLADEVRAIDRCEKIESCAQVTVGYQTEDDLLEDIRKANKRGWQDWSEYPRIQTRYTGQGECYGKTYEIVRLTPRTLGLGAHHIYTKHGWDEVVRIGKLCGLEPLTSEAAARLALKGYRPSWVKSHVITKPDGNLSYWDSRYVVTFTAETQKPLFGKTKNFLRVEWKRSEFEIGPDDEILMARAQTLP